MQTTERQIELKLVFFHQPKKKAEFVEYGGYRQGTLLRPLAASCPLVLQRRRSLRDCHHQ
jgi:hypothetical protein